MSAPLATVGQPASNETPQTENREGLIPIQMPRRDVKFVFMCHGDSMLPRIQDGDYIGVGDAIGRYENFLSGVPYLIQTTDGRFMVKMVQDPGPSSPYLLLSTEHPKYELADGGNDFSLAGSLCHGWSAIPVIVYYKYILGIRPVKCGFSDYSIDISAWNGHVSRGRVYLPATGELLTLETDGRTYSGNRIKAETEEAGS